MSPSDAVLERLFSRYRQALAANRTSRSTTSMATVEAVIEARVLLFEHLVSTGWAPPPGVERQLAVDALLLEQPPSALAG
jgi:hypothetical protein